MANLANGSLPSERIFFEKWVMHVRRMSVRVAPRGAADDVAQEVRVRLLHLVRRQEPPSDPYVRAVIRNETRKAAAHERRVALRSVTDVGVEECPDPDVTQPSDLAARKVAVVTWVQTLGYQERRVYDLLYVRGLSQREAAIEMEVTQPRVAQIHKQLLVRGCRDLATLDA